jgi:hypothetical protein
MLLQLYRLVKRSLHKIQFLVSLQVELSGPRRLTRNAVAMTRAHPWRGGWRHTSAGLAKAYMEDASHRPSIRVWASPMRCMLVSRTGVGKGKAGRGNSRYRCPDQGYRSDGECRQTSVEWKPEAAWHDQPRRGP